MSCGFIRIETSDLVGLKTLFGWASDWFGLKLSSDESRIHSDWNFLQMSDGFIRSKNLVRMSLGFIRIHSHRNFLRMSCGFIRIEISDLVGLKTLLGWASDWFGLKLSSDELRIHSDWNFGFSRFKNIVRMSLAFIRIETSDSFGLK